jgi:hypothetical protein
MGRRTSVDCTLSRRTHPRAVGRDEVVARAAGQYDSRDNILQLWFPSAVELADERNVFAPFDKMVSEWIARCDDVPYLAICSCVESLPIIALGTLFYGADPDSPGMVGALGDGTLVSRAFADEASALEDIRRAKAGWSHH